MWKERTVQSLIQPGKGALQTEEWAQCRIWYDYKQSSIEQLWEEFLLYHNILEIAGISLLLLDKRLICVLIKWRWCLIG